MTSELLFELFLAISVIESGVNPEAVGDQGRAVGIVQIHPGMVNDVNRIGGYRFTPEDRKKVKYSWLMFRVFMNHYARDLEPQDAARMWNGGPRGLNKPSTVKYAEQVMAVLETPAAVEAARRLVTKELIKEIDR